MGAPSHMITSLMHQLLLICQTALLLPQALGEPLARRSWEDKLREQLGSRFAVVRQARLAEADAAITNMIGGATNQLTKLFHTEPLDIAAVDKFIKQFLVDYDKKVSEVVWEHLGVCGLHILVAIIRRLVRCCLQAALCCGIFRLMFRAFRLMFHAILTNTCHKCCMF